jgi:hypothetical protein
MSNANLVYEDLVARGKQVRTAKNWRAYVVMFEGCCGVKDSYVRGDIIKFLAVLRGKGVTQNSINSIMRPLKLLCEVQKWPDGFPRLAMPKVIGDELCRPVLSLGEVHSLIINARQVCDARELAFLAAATTYGLRREEVGTLEVMDGFVKVHTVKGGAPTVQLIPPEIKEYFRGYRGSKDLRWLSRIFERIGKETNLGVNGRCGWHSIRRALATELVDMDISALKVLRFMRWSDASMKKELGMLVLYARKDQEKIDRSIFAVHPFLPFWVEYPLTDIKKVAYTLQNVNSPLVLARHKSFQKIVSQLYSDLYPQHQPTHQTQN